MKPLIPVVLWYGGMGAALGFHVMWLALVLGVLFPVMIGIAGMLADGM